MVIAASLLTEGLTVYLICEPVCRKVVNFNSVYLCCKANRRIKDFSLMADLASFSQLESQRPIVRYKEENVTM